VLPLHGELPVEQQARVLQAASDGRRRVVLATNVAESSVTLPGVRVVIDSGQAREPRYDPNSGFTRLDVVAIARPRPTSAPAAPVAWPKAWPGGCGRSRSGWSRSAAEIDQVELAGLALELAAWGSSDLRFLDRHLRPDGRRARTAATAGRAVRRRGDHRARQACWRWVRIRGWRRCCWPRPARAQALAADLAALLEARDPLRQAVDALAERWRALAAFRMAARRPMPTAARWPPSMRRQAVAAAPALRGTPPASIEAHELGDLLAHAFPTASPCAIQAIRCATCWPMAAWPPARQSDLRGEPWLVASELRFEARDALLLRAAPVDEARLRADLQRFVDRGRGVGQRAARAGGAARNPLRPHRLDSRSAGRVDPQHAAQALTDAVASWAWRRCRGPKACASGRRGGAAALDARARPARPVRYAACWPRWTTGCSPRSPARPGWMRWARKNSAKR
jgi:ATP-dependent helicase HrpB